MNGKERRKYANDYEAINKRFRKKYFPKVFQALNNIASSLISTIRESGVREGQYQLQTTLINDSMFPVVQSMYKEAGLYHAKLQYRIIRAEINQKGLGRNEQWVQSILEFLRMNLLEFAVLETTKTIRERLLGVIQEGIDQEMSIDEILNALKDDKLIRYQAERIVRTEIGRAANTGKKIASDSFPYEMSKTWISFQDMRTRGVSPQDKKDHYHMDGQTVDYNEKFTDPRSSEQIDYPNAPGGSAGMVINCRCTFSIEPKRDKNGNLIRTANISKESKERMQKELSQIREEVKEIASLLKPVDVSGAVNNMTVDMWNKVTAVTNTFSEINKQVTASVESIKEDLQMSLHNINRVNQQVKSATDREIKGEVDKLGQKFDEIEKKLNSIDYSPNIEVKSDSAEVISEISSMKDEIVNGLNELRDLLKNKRNYSIEFERDKDGLLMSPIKVIG